MPKQSPLQAALADRVDVRHQFGLAGAERAEPLHPSREVVYDLARVCRQGGERRQPNHRAHLQPLGAAVRQLQHVVEEASSSSHRRSIDPAIQNPDERAQDWARPDQGRRRLQQEPDAGREKHVAGRGREGPDAGLFLSDRFEPAQPLRTAPRT
jgi:hypothetical protein